VTAGRIDQWMSYYDLNNDGVVDPQEWAYRVREDRLQQLVANTDADSDGQMTAAEMLAAGHSPEQVTTEDPLSAPFVDGRPADSALSTPPP